MSAAPSALKVDFASGAERAADVSSAPRLGAAVTHFSACQLGVHGHLKGVLSLTRVLHFGFMFVKSVMTVTTCHVTSFIYLSIGPAGDPMILKTITFPGCTFFFIQLYYPFACPTSPINTQGNFSNLVPQKISFVDASDLIAKVGRGYRRCERAQDRPQLFFTSCFRRVHYRSEGAADLPISCFWKRSFIK